MTEYRIWPSTNGSGPVTGGFTDDLGVQFKITASGYTLNGYYYWVDATQNDVDHTKYSWRLYSTTNGTSGTLISNSTVSVAADFTPGQWNYQALPTPISLTSGTTYVASLHYSGTSNTHYSHVVSYWSAGGAGAGGITNGPLTAPDASQALGGNQCPENEPSASAAFPASTFSGSNYWIDVSVNSVSVSAAAGLAAATVSAKAPNLSAPAGAASATAVIQPAQVGQLAQTLHDEFTGTFNSNGLWNGSYNSPTDSAGQLNLSCVAAYTGAFSTNRYNLTNSHIVVQAVSVPTGGNHTRQTIMQLQIDNNNWIELDVTGDGASADNFRGVFKTAGTQTTQESVAYNSAVHKWWKIQHDVVSGTGYVSFWYGPDGMSWTQLGTGHAAAISVTALSVQLACGFYGTETSPPAAVLDNVNPGLAPAGLAAATAAGLMPVVAATSAHAGLAAATAAAQVPTEALALKEIGGTLHGAYAGFGSTGVAGIARTENVLHSQAQVAADYLTHAHWTDFTESTMRSQQLDGWRTWRNGRPNALFVYGIPLLTDDNPGDFAGVVAGTYDAYFTSAGNALVDSGNGDAIVMLGWEPNNASIGPWQATSNPSGYRLAFQHVVTLLRGISGNTFKFSLATAIGPSGSVASHDDVYPGDSYVDYVGQNVYDVHFGVSGETAQQRWNFIATSVMGLNDFVAFANSHSKTMVCHEWGLYAAGDSFNGGGDNPFFIDQMHSYFKANGLYFQSYFDWDWGGGFRSAFPNAEAEYTALFAESNASASAKSPTVGFGVVAGKASATAAALQPTINISGNVHAPAGLVAVTAAARQPPQSAPARVAAAVVAVRQTGGGPASAAAAGRAVAAGSALSPAFGDGAVTGVAAVSATALPPRFFFGSSRVLRVSRQSRTFQVPADVRKINVGETT